MFCFVRTLHIYYSRFCSGTLLFVKHAIWQCSCVNSLDRTVCATGEDLDFDGICTQNIHYNVLTHSGCLMRSLFRVHCQDIFEISKNKKMHNHTKCQRFVYAGI